MDSSQLSSAMQTLNNSVGPLKNIVIMLGDDNNGTLDADIDLSSHGVNLKPHISVDGSFTTDGKHFNFHLTKAKAGPIPIKTEYLEKGQQDLNKIVNNQIDKMFDLTIEELSVKNGVGHYKGNFLHQIDLNY